MKTNLFLALIAFARRASCTLLTCTLALLPGAVGAATGDPDSFNPQPNGRVMTAIVQPDGKILLGGSFSTVDGATILGGVSRVCLARYGAGGTLDTNFNINVNGEINAVAVQDDGKILVGGIFGAVGGVPRSRLARINPEGTLDTSFDPNPNTTVNAIVPQADGKILLGGWFVSIGGTTNRFLARLESNGTVETNFNAGLNLYVNSVALQTDGKILLGGGFSAVGGSARSHIARLNGDGTLDTNFNCSANADVYCVGVQADGKILLGGAFTNVNGVARSYLARVNSDGALDTNFTTSVSAIVQSLAVQADGKILLGGAFTNVNGVARTYLARLQADGTLDTTLNPSVLVVGGGREGKSVALQADGKILFAGFFDQVNGQARAMAARLENDPATQTLTAATPDRVQWLRGGTAPETQSVSFEVSTNNGLVFAPLGNGTRISGGWELTGLSLPVGGSIRARARTTGGYFNGSSSQAEAIGYFGPLTAINLSAAETYVEDTPLNLTDIVVNSGNTSNITATLTLSTVAAGSFSTATSGAATSTYNAGTGVWTASGPIADVNTLLAGVRFNPATNFNADFTIATSLTDGIAPALTGSKAMTGTAVNDPPTATGLSVGQVYIEDTALNLADIVVSDVDGTNVTATLMLSTNAAGSLSTGTSGAVTSTYNAATGIWTASGPITNVNALLAGVTFNPALNFNANFTIATSVTDEIAPAITGNKVMTGYPVNDEPAGSNSSAAETYTEDTPLNLIDIVVSDVDSTNVTVTLTLSTNAAGSLTTATSGAVTSTFNAATGVWTASGPIADVNALLAGVTFNPATNFNANFYIATGMTDGTSPAPTRYKTMTGIAVNDAPIASNLSAAETYIEDAPLNLIDIVVSDVDSTNVTATLTLSPVAAGSLSTATSGAVTSTYNAGTGLWTASGRITNVNALLAGVTFNPATNFNADFTIATSVSDGIAPAITGSKAMTGTAVNDPPTLANPIPDQGARQGIPFSFTFATNTFADVDAGNVFTYAATNVPAWLTFTPATRTFSGTPADADVGFVDITVTATDNGTPSTASVSDIFRLTVTNVNDVPVFTKGPNLTNTFGTTTAQTVLSWATGISDGDLTVTQALTFNVSVISGGSIFTTPPAIASNGTLTYTPNGTSGTANVNVSLTDDATAGGPALTSAVQSFTITVDAGAPLPPVINANSLTVLSNGAFQFTFSNANNFAFNVLAATNVSLPASNWTVLGLATNIGGGLYQFTDPAATNFASRFYRLRSP